MFESPEDVYQHVGKAIRDAIPEEDWNVAWLDILLDRLDTAITLIQSYKTSTEEAEKDFNVNVSGNADISKAVFALFKLMRKDADDVPWNKARYTLYPDGKFDIEYKYDPDFAWLKSLDPDSDAYEELDVDIEEQIESWDGLPEDAERPWRS